MPAEQVLEHASQLSESDSFELGLLTARSQGLRSTSAVPLPPPRYYVRGKKLRVALTTEAPVCISQDLNLAADIRTENVSSSHCKIEREYMDDWAERFLDLSSILAAPMPLSGTP